MPLLTTERQAVDILVNRIRTYGPEGLKNFAREVLGAHSSQASKLADIATAIHGGSDPASFDLADDSQRLVQVTQEVDGKQLNLTLKADRLPITSYEELVDFYEIDTDVWHPTRQVFNFWGSAGTPNFQVKASFERDDYRAASKEDREAFREWASQFAPQLDIPWDGNPNGKMLELIIADLHVDRVGGVERAIARLIAGSTDILGKTKALYGTVEEVNLVLLGDTFNADNGRDTTTAGTPQNSEDDWRANFRLVREAIAHVAMKAATVGQRVRIHILPGNHDYERSYYLADTLWSYFRNTDAIEVELDDSPRRYLYWGYSVIGLTHGDRIKPADLAMTMFREARTEDARFLEWHLGHNHTRREEEVHGVHFQWFRSPQDPSEWEHKNLFNHNRRDITGIVWDLLDGPEDTFRYTVRSDA